MTRVEDRILEMLPFRGRSKEGESAELMEEGCSENRRVNLFSSQKKKLSRTAKSTMP